MPYLDCAGVRMYYEVSGSGDPLVLLHGGFCSIETLRPQMSSLARSFRVHAPERPGQGRTADRPGPITFEGMVADTLAYLDVLGIRRAHLLGFSDGAITGLLLARDHPDRVRSLVSISANLDPSGLHEDEPDSGKEDETHLADYRRLSPDGPGHAEVVLAKLQRMWEQEPRIEAASLGRISCPVLVMAGDRDSIILEHTVGIARSIPQAQLCIVPGATHNLMAQRSELVNLAAAQFLQASSGVPPVQVSISTGFGIGTGRN